MLDRKPAQPTADPSRSHLRVVRGRDAILEEGVLRQIEVGPLDLELGGYIPNVNLAFRTWGSLNASADNAVLILHALTGDSLCAGPGGWWEPVIGPGNPIDTDNAFVLCINVLGGCSGSTGPSSANPATGQPWAMTFPLITIGDIVNAQRRLVEHLGIRRLTVVGGSIGGFQALEWATRHADMVDGSLVIAAAGSLSALGIATHSEIGRRAIMADPEWRNGAYQSTGTFPSSGLAIARMAAMTTYHSRESLGSRFGRNSASRPALYPGFGPTFDVEGYLHYHGEALVRRFDANSYLYLTRAMDLYDVARDGGPETWLGRIDAPIDLVGISSDWLFTPDEIRGLRDQLAWLDRDVLYTEIASPNGHDAFLKDWNQLNPIVGAFLERVGDHVRARAECAGSGSPP
jgi:homoserine O-acetyltransferase